MTDEPRTDRRHIVAKIVARAWTDKAFKADLLTDPEPILREYGMEVPEGMTVRMHQDTSKVEHGVIPAPPPNLTPEQLKDPANVHIVYCFTQFHHKVGPLRGGGNS
jgi:hypothetical protein